MPARQDQGGHLLLRKYQINATLMPALTNATVMSDSLLCTGGVITDQRFRSLNVLESGPPAAGQP